LIALAQAPKPPILGALNPSLAPPVLGAGGRLGQNIAIDGLGLEHG
jgi:hypothetical protein